MHFFSSFDPSALGHHPTYEGHSEGYVHESLVAREEGSVHTGLSVNELAPGGRIDPHVHSFEESFYVLSGEALVTINGSGYHLTEGDYAVVKVGTPHACEPLERSRALAQMAAPQPKPIGAERDTFFLKDRSFPTTAARLNLQDLKGNLLSHFDAGQIPPVAQRPPSLTGLEGVFLKWLIDEKISGRVTIGCCLSNINRASGSDCTTIRSRSRKLILSGEVEGTMDGKTYLGKPGDVFWTGVGCVHGFANVGNQPVTWLETFAPQPPKENVFRFMAEWERRAQELEG